MDGLLNFSREILPANRGGQMDAPLVLTTRLNPTEVDKEALNVDSGWFYERWFYEATLSQPHPKQIAEKQIWRRVMDLSKTDLASCGLCTWPRPSVTKGRQLLKCTNLRPCAQAHNFELVAAAASMNCARRHGSWIP